MTTLTDWLMTLGPGRHDFALNGVPMVLFYDEEQAIGDDGRPVYGFKTGHYEVFQQPEGSDGLIGLKEIIRINVSPHTHGRGGNRYAQRHACSRIAEALERTGRA